MTPKSVQNRCQSRGRKMLEKLTFRLIDFRPKTHQNDINNSIENDTEKVSKNDARRVEKGWKWCQNASQNHANRNKIDAKK